MPNGTVSISNFAFATSHGTNSMPSSGGVYSPASFNGYCGTISFDWSNAGLTSVNYCLIYDVTYYHSGSVTNNTSTGTLAYTAPANSSGSKSIDFFADTSSMSSGEYQLNIGTYYGGGVGAQVGALIVALTTPTDYSGGRPFRKSPGDDPLPDPQPGPGTHSGSNPPPTSGPVGPGT